VGKAALLAALFLLLQVVRSQRFSAIPMLLMVSSAVSIWTNHFLSCMLMVHAVVLAPMRRFEWAEHYHLLAPLFQRAAEEN
jgi:hypothetical protein